MRKEQKRRLTVAGAEPAVTWFVLCVNQGCVKGFFIEWRGVVGFPATAPVWYVVVVDASTVTVIESRANGGDQSIDYMGFVNRFRRSEFR